VTMRPSLLRPLLPVDDNGGALAVAVAPPVLDPVPGVLGRLRVLLRRDGLGGADVLRFGDLRLDPDTRIVRRARRSIELTPIEFNLLELFLRNPGRVLTRSVIFRDVWGFDFGVMSNSLNVYVGHLRRKTEAAGEPRLIHTVRGVGYVLRETRS
jgi:two-component system response regulator MprA